MASMFLITVTVLPTAGAKKARLTVIPKGRIGVTLDVSSGGFASVFLDKRDGNFDFDTKVTIDDKAASAMASEVPSDGALHVQIIGKLLAVGHIVHRARSAAPPPFLSCPNNPTHKVSCPASLTCLDETGVQYVLTC
jgi:hypothetical protein